MPEMSGRCPRCQGKWEEGFILDRNGNDLTEAWRILHWFSGRPRYGFWGQVIRSNRREMPVEVYRCTKCGYLELYASEAIPEYPVFK